MKKVILLALLGVVLVSCSHNIEYVKKEDFMLVKKKVEKNRFAVKQALSANIEIKKAFKEVNNQLKKQNKINKRLFIEIENLKADIKKIKKKTQKEEKLKQEKQERKLIGIVLPDKLNLRKYPHIASKNIIKQLKRGEEVEVLESIVDWYKVRAGRDEGYVYRDYLKVIKK